MNRVERSSAAVVSSEFDVFQATITLEEQVHRRTAELKEALRENQRITRKLQDSEERFRRVVDQPLVGISIGENGKYTYSNAKFAKIFGYTTEEVLHLEPVDVVMDQDRLRVTEYHRKQMSGECPLVDYTFRGKRKDGSPVDIELHGSAMELGDDHLIFSVILDVSERVRAEREREALYELLREQSIRDGLTGLFNRRYLDAALEQELARASRARKELTVVLCDIDHFKAVNDKHGHLAGDEVLRVLSQVIRKHSRNDDLVCRYGGEEFLLILPSVANADACMRADEMREAIAGTSIQFGDFMLSVTASFGVASFPQDADSTAGLLTAADKALYAAKRTGRNKVVCHQSLG